MTAKFLSGDAWREAVDLKVLIGGTWRRIDSAKMMIGGAWQTVYVYDIVGPTAPTSVKAEWSNTSGNACAVSWTQPTDADLDYVDLYVNRSGSSTGPWTSLGRYTGSGAKSYTDTSVTMSSYTAHQSSNTRSNIHYYRLVPVDVRGNVGTEVIKGSTGKNQTVVRGMYSSPYYVNPTDSRTWRNTAWRVDTTVQDSTGAYERVVQGYFTDPPATNHSWGFYFFTAFPTGINVSSANVYVARQNGGTGCCIPPYLRASAAPQSLVGSGSNPTGFTYTAATVGSAYATPANGNTRVGNNTIPNSWIDGFQAGTYKSILLYTAETDAAPSTNYSVWSSVNEDIFFGGAPGMISINHTG